MLTWSAAVCLLIVQLVSAGPIHRDFDVVRRAHAPPNRFVILPQPIPSHTHHARHAGPTEVLRASPETPAPSTTSSGSDDGKLPSIEFSVGDSSIIASLESRISAAPIEASPTGSPPASSTVQVTSTSSTVQATSTSSTVQATSTSSTVQATSNIGSSTPSPAETSSVPASLTSTSSISSSPTTAVLPVSVITSEQPAAATPTQSKEDGKVPAVGVGAGNTSLLEVLSSLIAASTQNSIPVVADTAQITQVTAESTGLAPGLTSQPCNTTSTALSTSVAPAPTPGITDSQTSFAPSPIPIPDSSTQATATIIVPIPGSDSSLQPPVTSPAPASTVEAVPGAGQEQATPAIPGSPTNSPSIAAGETVTLRISTTMTTTIVPPDASQPALSEADESAGTVTISIPTTMTITVPSTAEAVTSSGTPSSLPSETPPNLPSTSSSPSETASSLPSEPVPLASTTVTPLVTQLNLATATSSDSSTATPQVSVELPAPPATSEAAGVTIPFAGFSIVIRSSPAPTAVGNTVIPIMEASTVTVTTTVTVR